MRLQSVRLLLCLSTALLLGACHEQDNPSRPGGATPVAAMQGTVELLKQDNFNGLWKHALPPADYATLRDDWQQQMKQRAPVTPAERARFNEFTQQFTAPDAADKLDAELLPKLAAMQQKYGDQLPILISVGDALAKKSIAEGSELTAEQKMQASSAMDVITPWAQKAPWFDAAKARQAIAVAVATARGLQLKSADQLRSMNFDVAMQKYATGFAGIKQLLAIYGLSIDDTLNSVKVSKISEDGDHAVVKLEYSLLGQPLSTESTLLKVDGRWYSQDLLQNVRNSHQQLQQQDASASSAAGPASAVSAPARPVVTRAPATAASAATAARPD